MIGPPIRFLEHAQALPLAIDPHFQFRKTKTFLLDKGRLDSGKEQGRNHDNKNNRMLTFERNRLLFGAITVSEERARFGNYFTFFWRADRMANLRVRLEYRQANSGPKVHAFEMDYPMAIGSYQTDFKVIGEDYKNNGPVTAWRAILIEYNNRDNFIESARIVALTQSYLWQ